MTHPDFEHYDNIGRSAEQIAAAHFGIATRDDLLRWAKRDAEPFLGQHPLPAQPPAALDPAPYLAALAAAESPAEVSAVTQHLLNAAEATLTAVSEVLVAIARRDGRNRFLELGTPPRTLMNAASRSLSVLALADEADLAVLRAEYDPAPAPRTPQAEQSLPPAPPKSPPAGPTPSR